MDAVKVGLAAFRDALKAEGTTSAGRVNFLGTFLAFVLIAAAGLLDVWQAIVRTWNDHYTAGAPSLLTLLVVFGVIFLACTLILALTADG